MFSLTTSGPPQSIIPEYHLFPSESKAHENDPYPNNSCNTLATIQSRLEKIRLSNIDEELKIDEYANLLNDCQVLETNEPSQALQELKNTIHKSLEDQINLCLPKLLHVEKLSKLYNLDLKYKFTIKNPEALKTCLESYIDNTYCYIFKLAQYLSRENFMALLDFFPKEKFLEPRPRFDNYATTIWMLLNGGTIKEKAESINKILSHFQFNEKEMVRAFGHYQTLLDFSVKTHNLDLFSIARKGCSQEIVEIPYYCLLRGIDEAIRALENKEISQEKFNTFLVELNKYAVTMRTCEYKHKKTILNLLFENWTKNGYSKLIKMLLEAGADVYLCNSEGSCAFDWIMQNTFKMPEPMREELFISIPEMKRDWEDLNNIHIQPTL